MAASTALTPALVRDLSSDISRESPNRPPANAGMRLHVRRAPVAAVGLRLGERVRDQRQQQAVGEQGEQGGNSSLDPHVARVHYAREGSEEDVVGVVDRLADLPVLPLPLGLVRGAAD